MDLTTNKDHAIGDVVDIAQGIGNIFRSAKDKKIAREAQAIADKGNYWNLTATAKGMIEVPYYIMNQVQGKGITLEAVKNLPRKPIGTPLEEIIAELQFRSGGSIGATLPGGGLDVAQVAEQAKGTDIKKLVPWILGAIVVGMIVYFISKK
jgi:hypothetical protein